MPVHGFYPNDSEELKKMINSFIETGSDVPKIENAKACVLPHAGYTFSGSIAMHTLLACKEKVKNNKQVLVTGPDHTGTGTTDKPHAQEHSTDVQKPLIRALNKDAEIKEKVLGSELSFNDLKEMAQELIDKNIFYIASSDFIHFGPNYAYTPQKAGTEVKEQVKWVKQRDSRIAKLISQLKAKDFYNLIEKEQYPICGYKPITLTIITAKMLGATQAKVIEHKASYEIMPNQSFVDYMGIVIY